MLERSQRPNRDPLAGLAPFLNPERARAILFDPASIGRLGRQDDVEQAPQAWIEAVAQAGQGVAQLDQVGLIVQGEAEVEPAGVAALEVEVVVEHGVGQPFDRRHPFHRAVELGQRGEGGQRLGNAPFALLAVGVGAG